MAIHNNAAIRRTERCMCYYCQDKSYFSICIVCLYNFQFAGLEFPPALHTVNGLYVAKMTIILWLYPVVIIMTHIWLFK